MIKNTAPVKIKMFTFLKHLRMNVHQFPYQDWQPEYLTPTDPGDWHAIERTRVGYDHGTAY